LCMDTKVCKPVVLGKLFRAHSCCTDNCTHHLLRTGGCRGLRFLQGARKATPCVALLLLAARASASWAQIWARLTGGQGIWKLPRLRPLFLLLLFRPQSVCLCVLCAQSGSDVAVRGACCSRVLPDDDPESA
jgi:hypothetical protein